MRRITVFADGRTMEWTISTGQRVSFKRIVGDKVIEESGWAAMVIHQGGSEA